MLKSELVRDVVQAGAIVGGAVLQAFFGGSWLLLVGSLAMGLRISFLRDDRRGMTSTVFGCLLWFVLHLFLVNIGRVGVAAEILAFSVLMVVFWFARLKSRERVAEESLSLREMQDAARERTDRLRQLEHESESMIRESEEWSKLFGVARSIGEVIREDEIIEIVREAVRMHLKLPSYVLMLVKDGVIRVGAQKGFDDEALAGTTFLAGSDSLAAWFVRQRDPVLVDNLSEDGRFKDHLVPYGAVVALPMWAHDQPLGVLIAFDTQSRTFSRQDFTRASILAKQLALGIRKTSLYRLIEELSITDGLTKLCRYRYFMERFEGELERARRYSRPLSLLMGDLDFMKRANDTHGHLEGDDVLKLTARVMEQYFKRPAIIARYGGDEFAMLLPDTDKDAAIAQAETFREGLNVTPPPGDGDRPPLSMSIGVASFPVDAQTRRDLIARADEALYQGKEGGRNLVCAYDAAAGTGGTLKH